jgi:hypothetical protein
MTTGPAMSSSMASVINASGVPVSVGPAPLPSTAGRVTPPVTATAPRAPPCSATAATTLLSAASSMLVLPGMRGGGGWKRLGACEGLPGKEGK